ncbi:uncharacterized protein B0H18DRAFT_963559 [Fomitopsis serialis]|uniref:uncharacterized protein n=1 Tax=Fomitopsis serialis TaxID=139415 RepID=UPI0020072918|nr:uncharacterized protein B0H18DRAFT_963559 [Neoantrodia serialis]KAH9910266.1 hypothetical protein B0H18DRAFT_963559 [Neoantrodia serialis]
MVGTWDIERVRKYLRDYAGPGRRPHRKPLVFTDRPPSADKWTGLQLFWLNRTVRSVYNSPVSFDVFEEIVTGYLFTQPWRDSLNYADHASELWPQMVRRCFDWLWDDPPEEGAWKPGMTVEEWLVGWRNRQPRRILASASIEEQEAAMQPFAEIWWHNDRLFGGGPAQFDEDADHAALKNYTIDMRRVTAQQREDAILAGLDYLVNQVEGAPRGRKTRVGVRAVARKAGLPDATLDKVYEGADRCERCQRPDMPECRVPATDVRCVACIGRKLGCSFKNNNRAREVQGPVVLREERQIEQDDAMDVEPDPETAAMEQRLAQQHAALIKLTRQMGGLQRQVRGRQLRDEDTGSSSDSSSD